MQAAQWLHSIVTEDNAPALAGPAAVVIHDDEAAADTDVAAPPPPAPTETVEDDGNENPNEQEAHADVYESKSNPQDHLPNSDAVTTTSESPAPCWDKNGTRTLRSIGLYSTVSRACQKRCAGDLYEFSVFKKAATLTPLWAIFRYFSRYAFASLRTGFFASALTPFCRALVDLAAANDFLNAYVTS